MINSQLLEFAKHRELMIYKTISSCFKSFCTARLVYPKRILWENWLELKCSRKVGRYNKQKVR